jgi:hypothetical protein
MKILLALSAVVLAPLCAAAECVYLAGSTVVRSLVVLDAADFTEHFAIDGAGGVLSRGLVVRGNPVRAIVLLARGRRSSSAATRPVARL